LEKREVAERLKRWYAHKKAIGKGTGAGRRGLESAAGPEGGQPYASHSRRGVGPYARVQEAGGLHKVVQLVPLAPLHIEIYCLAASITGVPNWKLWHLLPASGTLAQLSEFWSLSN
jgi:hypothetical protein